ARRIPEHVPVWRADQDRTVADPNFRRDRNAMEVRFHLRNFSRPTLLHLRQREPALTGPRDVLPIVRADRARIRRLRGIRMLQSTRRAHPNRHRCLLDLWSLVFGFPISVFSPARLNYRYDSPPSASRRCVEEDGAQCRLYQTPPMSRP